MDQKSKLSSHKPEFLPLLSNADSGQSAQRRIPLILLCLLLLLPLGCRRPPHSTEPNSPLIVGMELAYPPFEMTDEQGQPSGISVDLAHALGAYLQRPVQIENIPFDGLIPALKTGRIHLILSSLTATEERRQSIAFSDPYLQTGLSLLTKSSSSLQSIEDLDAKDKIVVVKQATTGHAYASQNLRLATVLVVDQESAAVLEVIQGKADAFIYDQMSVYKHWQRHPDTTRALLKPFQEEAWAVGLRQDTPDLLNQVNAFIEAYRKEGGFEKLGDKYLLEQKEAFKSLGYPFYF